MTARCQAERDRGPIFKGGRSNRLLSLFLSFSLYASRQKNLQPKIHDVNKTGGQIERGNLRFQPT